MLTNITRKLFILQKLKGVGPSTLRAVAELPELATQSVDDLARHNRKIEKALATPNALAEAVQKAEDDIGEAEKFNVRIISTLDDEFPKPLKRTTDSPFFLYVRGQLERFESRSIAIIGTRKPTEHGNIIAKRVTKFFVQDGWSIVSGLALGCDAIAHGTALEQGGHTVAVLAHGLHTIAPKQHERLASQIVEKGGALVTEYAFGMDPFPHQFVKRDKIQAGLSQGVVMIQSDVIGGSLHASRAAIGYGRILAVPSPTELDVSRKEIKIQANQLLSGGSDKEKSLLLKCNEDRLERLFVIRSKDDYPRLSQALAKIR